MRAALAHRFGLGLVTVLVATGPAVAQEPASAALAAQLAAALDGAKLQNIAAKDPSGPTRYVGALYFQGLQLVVVSGAYQSPVWLDNYLGKREYREVYIELNGASDPASRVFVTDLGVNGLRIRPERDQPADSYEAGKRRTVFNRQWREQKLSEEEYTKIYEEAEARYVELLTALLAQVKAGS